MPNVRKKRAESTATKQAKEFASKSKFKSEGERVYGLAKKINKEAKDLESSVSEGQEKAGQQSLWASIGGALGGLALGVATGSLSWAVQGAAAGIGSYVGSQQGKAASQGRGSIGKFAKDRLGAKGKINAPKEKDYTFYSKEAESQANAFQDFHKSLNRSLAQRSLYAGIFAGAMAGGAESVYKGLKGLGTKVAGAGAKGVEASQILGSSSQPIALTASGAPAYGGTGKSPFTIGGTKVLSDTMGVGSSVAKGLESISSRSIASLIAPKAAEAAPSLMAGMGSTMKNYALLSGSAAIAGYRPELGSLKPMKTYNVSKRYG